MQDTHPKAAVVQIELLRQATVAERFARLCSLTRMAIFHAKRAIARANPGRSQRELDLIFVETHYGPDLARQLGEFLDGRPV